MLISWKNAHAARYVVGRRDVPVVKYRRDRRGRRAVPDLFPCTRQALIVRTGEPENGTVLGRFEPLEGSESAMWITVSVIALLIIVAIGAIDDYRHRHQKHYYDDSHEHTHR